MKTSRLILYACLAAAFAYLIYYEKHMPLRISDLAGSPEQAKAVVNAMKLAVEVDREQEEYAKSQGIDLKSLVSPPGTIQSPPSCFRLVLSASRSVAKTYEIKLEYSLSNPIVMEYEQHSIILTAVESCPSGFTSCGASTILSGKMPVFNGVEIPFIICEMGPGNRILKFLKTDIISVVENKDSLQKASWFRSEFPFQDAVDVSLMVKIPSCIAGLRGADKTGVRFIYDSMSGPFSAAVEACGVFKAILPVEGKTLAFITADSNSNNLLNDEIVRVYLSDITSARPGTNLPAPLASASAGGSFECGNSVFKVQQILP
jgi:hypothetical protein